MDLNALAPSAPQPAAAPDVSAADTKPGTAQEGGTQSDATGAPETVEETEQQKAERIVQERKVREERARRKINARFGELTEQIRQKDRIIETLAGRAPQPGVTQPGPAGDGAPRREQYESYEDFVEARAEWRAERKAQETVQRHLEGLTRQQREAVERFQAIQTAERFAQRVEEFGSSNQAFAEVLESDVDIGTAGAVLMEMEDAPQIMLAIHQNPKIAEQLRSASTHQQGVILGRLSAELKAKPPQVSKAPEPGNPVGGKPAAAAKDPNRMTYDEFVKWRRDQIAKRR